MSWVRGEGVLWRDSLERVLVLAPRDDEPFAMTGSAAEVWELLAEPVSLEDIARRLAARYDVPAAQVAGDTLPLLQELRARGAVCCR